MKKIQILQFVFAVFVSALFTSCTGTIPVPGGQIVFGNGGQQVRGSQNYGQQRPWGEKIVTTQEYRTPETRGVGIQIKGTPPTEVCVAVKVAVGHWCEDMHVQHGVWPTFDEAVTKAKSEFAKRGYNVKRSDTPAPNTFNIVQYKLHEEKIGIPEKVGDPTVERTEIGMQDVPDSILARSRAGERGIMYEVGKHPGLQQ